MPDLEMIILYLDDKIREGEQVQLKIGYEGKISSDLGGLYQTTYTDLDGKNRTAVTTQMEPTMARKMVPCFDEPDFKAVWMVKIIHPKGTKAIANGIELCTKSLDENFQVTKFKPTPRMSSYLLAIFVSEFEYLEKYTKNGVRFRVWARPEAMKMVTYALDSGVKVIDYYEQFFSISNLVALPDFSQGAMENWGLVNFREADLLYDEGIYLPKTKQRVATIISHELAHQWFGNLVTMSWWDDLWLNEGFANFVQYSGANIISNGNFRMAENFVTDDLSRALTADSKASSHPLSFKIDKAMEVIEAFDDISYKKGASVIRMIRQVIGEKNFQKGIQYYLKEHQYSNANSSDLLKSLNEKVPSSVRGPDGEKLNLENFADQWTTQMGYPLLTVTRLNSTTVRIDQKRFKEEENSLEQRKYRNPKHGFKWDVPIRYQDGNIGNLKMTWLKKDTPLLLHAPSPVVLNAESYGFYRVNYDETEWKAIGAQLLRNHKRYSSVTRGRLIEDLFRCATVDLVDYDLVFDFLKYLENEKEQVPWHFVFIEFQKIVNYYGVDPQVEFPKKFLLKLLKNNFDATSFEKLRSNYKDENQFFEMNFLFQLLDTECSFGDSFCVEKAAELFKTEVENECEESDETSKCNRLAAPLRQLSYCYGVQQGGIKNFNKVFNWYRNEKVQREKNYLLKGLSCIKDIQVLERLLENALNPTNSDFRLQDVVFVFAAIMDNPLSEGIFSRFLLERWQDFLPRMSQETSSLSQIIMILTRNINSSEGLQKLKTFHSSTKSAQKYNIFHAAFEEITIRIRPLEVLSASVAM
ncbi:unnamed protein product [Caenorhabditis auriculariae]|uniref:Aminopeptidase n=1 Tax=Caenorhabditis auriculariae TaxID=2777116 RepID=A0A8S1HLV0_9PELO|nr:unnamed protein product [Caenorhabditis auriculariae]